MRRTRQRSATWASSWRKAPVKRSGGPSVSNTTVPASGNAAPSLQRGRRPRERVEPLAGRREDHTKGTGGERADARKRPRAIGGFRERRGQALLRRPRHRRHATDEHRAGAGGGTLGKEQQQRQVRGGSCPCCTSARVSWHFLPQGLNLFALKPSSHACCARARSPENQ